MQYRYKRGHPLETVYDSLAGFHDAHVHELEPSSVELILMIVAMGLFAWGAWTAVEWTLDQVIKLLISFVERMKPSEHIMISIPSDFTHALTTNADHTFQLTPITPAQVLACLGPNGTLLKNARTVDEIVEMGEVHHVARLVMDREVGRWAGWELVGWNQWKEGGFVGGSSTIVVKVRGVGWNRGIYKRIMSECM